MNKYIYTIIILSILMLLLVFNSIADTKQIEHYVQEYKNIQEEKTSLIKENKELKEEINSYRVVIDTYNIPNNLDTRFEVK